MEFVKVKLTGKGHNQCPTCGLLFSRDSAFDKHRTGKFQPASDRRCLTEVEMVEKGMVKGENGFWRGSAAPIGYVHGPRRSQEAC